MQPNAAQPQKERMKMNATEPKMTVDIFNCQGLNEIDYGWVGINESDETDEVGGGWFFKTPSGLNNSFGKISGEITRADIEAAIESMDEDETWRPRGLSESEAAQLIREALENYAD